MTTASNQIITQVINNLSSLYGIPKTTIIILLTVIIIWSTIWKLLGLWKSAKKGSILWFIIIALTNTIGILPILYIYVFSEMNIKTQKKKYSKKKKVE